MIGEDFRLSARRDEQAASAAVTHAASQAGGACRREIWICIGSTKWKGSEVPKQVTAASP